MKKLIVYLLLLLAFPAVLFSQTRTVGATGADYETLKDAFDAINTGGLNGDIILQIIDNTTETSSASLNASGTGPSNYTSVTIYPTVSGKSISGSFNNALITLNGADNVTFDGRLNQTGSTIDLTISNASATTGASTILFINSAENNTVRYCTVSGSGTNGGRGVFYFFTSSAGNGNDENTIEYNNITNAGGARPDNVIYSLGATGFDNSRNTVSNNNIYDFLRPNSASTGIYISTFNSGWTISDNSFYQTDTFTSTTTGIYYVIRIASTGGSGFDISGNYIGGSAALCSGTWTKTGSNNLFYAIDLNSGTGTQCTIQNNTITNFSWTNSSNQSWRAIRILAGDVNASGNTIGNDSGTTSISLTNGGFTSGGVFYGIETASGGTIVIDNNKIGAITAGNSNTALATNIYGIYIRSAAGTLTISNNTIGSSTQSGSIDATSTSNNNLQYVRGIYNAGTGNITISNNTVANLTNSTSNANAATDGVVHGITSTGGTNIITGNNIFNLTIANSNNNLVNNASACGISLTSATLRTVTGNTIYNLSNTFTSFTGAVTGIYFAGGIAGNTVSDNFIHSLSIASGSSTASLYGIRIASGATTYSNNIITLGGNTETTIHGIYQTGTAENDNNLYFNTVYIGGTPASGTNRSYSLFSTGTGNARNFTNNILVNERSTTGGSDLHYALYIAAAGGTIVSRNNDYWVTGTGGTPGYYGATKTSLPIVTGADQGSQNLDPGFASPGGITAISYIPSNNFLLGFAGTGITTDYAGTTRSLTHPAMGAFEITVIARVDVYKSSVYQASYTYLRDAFYDLNTGVLSVGDFQIRINANITETASAVLNASGTGGAVYSSVTIFPTQNALTIDGNFAAPLIDLNGADNVTIDGRPNMIGTAPNLTLLNSSTAGTAGTSAIRFINDASSNIISYCNLRASPSGTTSGIVMFSTSTGTTGNDNNIISNNNITVAADADRVINAVYSAGTVSLDNSGNNISNNSIYNFLSRSATTYGIYITTNNNAWTISGNSFYETASAFVPTASSTIYFIRINTTTGSGFTIAGNCIGGQAALCGGSALTKTDAFDNAFFGIHLSTATGGANNIQGNTIRNISWNNATNAIWTGIQIAGGDANIGTPSGNNIGNTTGTGSVNVTNTTGSTLYGIYLTTSGTIDCRNNNIGSITAANNPANATNVYGIYKSASTGTTIINNNIIGSTSSLNSINSSSASTDAAQSVFGIYNGGTGAITISGNTISNLTNGTTNTNTGTLGEINGISSVNGTNTIANNIIRFLTIGNANANALNNASVCGISLTGTQQKIITGNTISYLSNTYDSFTGQVIGIYFSGGTTPVNQVSENFIHNLSVASGSPAGGIYGIRIASGASIYSNNIIVLGFNTTTTIYGIYETGAAGNNNSLYFNTLYIGGSPESGSLNSFALYSNVTTNTRNFRNNVFMNARSNDGATGSHYAIRVQGTSGLTIDYNNYLSTGSGGILGLLGGNRSNLASWQTATGQDASSISIDPLFFSAGGTAATDYIPEEAMPGVAGTGITTDFGLIIRSSPPTMGAWQSSGNKWQGDESSDWGTPGNWSKGVVPEDDANIQFHNSAVNNLELDGDRSVNNIINTTALQVVTSGNVFTVRGSLIFSNGAQIDASDSGSAVEFAGLSSVPQTIPENAFVDNKVNDLIINNDDNVTLDGTLNLLNELTVTSGRLDAVTNSPSFGYSGEVPQTIEADQFMNERIFNLIIENEAGVTLNTDFSINNDLTINSGNFTISATRLLTVNETLTNYAGEEGLVLRSDAAGDAQLISKTPGVPATVELYLTGDLVPPTENLIGRFHYFVPPVETMNIGNTPDEVGIALGLIDFAGDLLRYVESNAVNTLDEGWWYHNNLPGFQDLESDYGYNIYHWSTGDVLKFKGNLNATEHTFNLSFTQGNAGRGWNLIGNPFPCNYDLNGVAGLGTVVDGISNTVFYNNNGNYTYWNVLTKTGSSGGYTDVLPPMTGFFVLTSAEIPSSLVFPITSKTAATSDPRGLHKGAADPYSKGSDVTKIKLVLSKGAKADETIALLFEDATDGYNEHYDAPKLFASGSTSPDIYITKSGADYFMKAVKGPVTGTVTIPLKVVVKETGSHTINVTEFDNLGGMKVTLKHGTVETILSHGASYTFTSGTGTFTDFELVLGEEDITTGVETLVKGEFNTWYRNEAMNINSPDDILSGTGTVTIYDMQGKPVFNNKQVYLTAGETIQLPVNLKKGIYVVHIVADGKPYISKIVVF